MTSRPFPRPGARRSRRCCASAWRAHEHPLAVADALQAVPRSRPFESLDELAALDVPTVVIASRDEADPGHPLAVGERYAETIPGASSSSSRRDRRRARRSPGRAGSSRA